jgi:DNA primase
MATLKIRGRNVDVDIEKELGRFTWYRAKWGNDRLISCSPFRYDTSPSFYVYLQDTTTAFAGSWGDSGGEGEYKQGHFTQLLAFLMSVTESETLDYLLGEYASDWDGETELVVLIDRLRMSTARSCLPFSLLEPFKVPSDYLQSRGIGSETQRLYSVGYDEASKQVLFPYIIPNGKLAAIKKRRVDSKIFSYAAGGAPIRELVYGLDIAYKSNAAIAIMAEAEIDAMYATDVTGVLGIGVGNSSLSNEKADAIKRSPIEELIIGSDNDAAGEKLKRTIIAKLSGHVKLSEISHLRGKKDLNEYTRNELRSIIKNRKAIPPKLFGV